MRKGLILLLCLGLTGVFLLSACNSGAEVSISTPTSEESPTLPPPTLKATSTRVIKATPTRTPRPTITPTSTDTLTSEEAAAKIESLLETLFKDLDDTETILDSEIP